MQDAGAVSVVCCHKVMRMLQDAGLLTEERTELLLSWRHTGFSVHNRVRVEPEDGPGVERLARYIMRPPISLERIRWDGVGEVSYQPKGDQPPVRSVFVAAARGVRDRVSRALCRAKAQNRRILPIREAARRVRARTGARKGPRTPC